MKVTIYCLNNHQLPECWAQVKVLKNKKDIAVGFNIEELSKYPHLFNNIVAHEFCHIWAWIKKQNINHGRYWKSLMLKVGEKPYISI